MLKTFTAWGHVVFLWVFIGLVGIAAMLGVRLGSMLLGPMCLLACVAAFMAWRMGNGNIDRKVAAAAVMFALWTMGSLFMSATKTVGLEMVQAAWAFIIFFLWAAELKQEERIEAREWIAMLLPWIAVLCCAFGIAVYVLQPFPRFVGTFFDARAAASMFPNGFAAFLLLCWPLTIVSMKRGWGRAMVLGLLFACLALTLSRAAWMVLAVQVMVWWFASGKKIAWKPVVMSLVMAGMFIAVIAAARARYFPVPSAAARVTFTDEGGTVPVTERRDLWFEAWGLTRESPVWGWGPGSFVFASQRWQQHAYAVADDPHNVLLSLSAERGIPTAAAFAFIVMFCCWKGWKRKSNSMELCLVLAVLGVALHSLVDRDMHFVAIALPFWILLGLLLPSGNTAQETRRRTTMATSILAGVLLLSGFMHQTGDRALAQSEELLNAGSVNEAAEVLRQYVTLNTQDPRGWLMYGNALLKTEDRAEKAVDAYDMAFALGRFNYPLILEGFMNAAMHLEKPAIIGQRYDVLSDMLRVHVQAVVSNDHYAALSIAPETLEQTLRGFQQLYPSDADAYADMTNKVRSAAQQYRGQRAQSPAGLLW